jgi:hypothetical protein
MKTFMTTAVILAALTLPVFAEGDDPSAKQGDAYGTVNAPDEKRAPEVRPGAMEQGGMNRATTGAGSATTNKLTPDEAQKSTTGADGGSGGGSGGGGGGGSGNR